MLGDIYVPRWRVDLSFNSRLILDLILEVKQTFKILIVQKLDVFLSGRRNFNDFENRKKILGKLKKKKSKFFFVYLFGLRTFDTKLCPSPGSENW